MVIPVLTQFYIYLQPSPSDSKKSSRHSSPTRALVNTSAKTDKQQVPPHGAITKSQQVLTARAPAAAATGMNPYMNPQLYSSSFLSGEGSNAIQSLMGVKQAPAPKQPALKPPAMDAQFAAGGSGTSHPASFPSQPPQAAFNAQQAQQFYQQAYSQFQNRAQYASAAAAYQNAPKQGSSAQYPPPPSSGSQGNQQQQQFSNYPSFPPQPNYPPLPTEPTSAPPPPSQHYAQSSSQGHSQHQNYSHYSGQGGAGKSFGGRQQGRHARR